MKDLLKRIYPGKYGYYYLGIANVLFFLAVVVVNYLAVALPINGLSTGALSNFYPNIFVPAGFTFSIWGIIYLLLFGFVIWQLIDLYSPNSSGITKKIGIWFLRSCLANILWIFARHHQLVFLSLLIMICYLLVLIKITKRVDIGKKLGSWKDKLFVQVPFSVCLGWISVATIANSAAWLVFSGWNMWGMSNVFWTTIVINVATLLGLLALLKKHDIMYALVIVWAFIGIISKRMAEGPLGIRPIFWSLGIGIGFLLIGIGIKFRHWYRH